MLADGVLVIFGAQLWGGSKDRPLHVVLKGCVSDTVLILIQIIRHVTGLNVVISLLSQMSDGGTSCSIIN